MERKDFVKPENLKNLNEKISLKTYVISSPKQNTQTPKHMIKLYTANPVWFPLPPNNFGSRCIIT